MEVDESSLTGEAAPIGKDAERDLMLYASTKVLKGEGTVLVTAVGTYTQQGMIFRLMMSQGDDVEAGISPISQCTLVM